MCRRVTPNFVIVFVIGFLTACTNNEATEADIAFLKQLDSISTAKIDSIAIAVERSCDSTAPQKIALMVDSLMQADSLNK